MKEAKDLQGMYREKDDPCLLMRSTGSIRDSRIICSRLWRTEPLSLIGATTENPYFEVNGALLSRSSIFELKASGAGGHQGSDPAGGYGYGERNGQFSCAD